MNSEENTLFYRTNDKARYASIKKLGKTAIDSYKNQYFNKDLILYNDWKSKIELINREEALERKMGSYLDDIIQSSYLEKYRPTQIVKEGKYLAIESKSLFTYDERSLLIMQYCPYGFYWTYDEAIELYVLKSLFLLDWNSDVDLEYYLGKLIMDNQECAWGQEAIRLILRFHYMAKQVADDWKEMRTVMDDCIYSKGYYISKKLPDIPDFVKGKKAMKLWEGFTRLGYMVKKSKRYVGVPA